MTSIHQAALRSRRTHKPPYVTVRSLDQCCQKRGIVVKLRIVNPKKPNSARRRIARVRLSNNFIVSSRIKGEGHNLQPFSNVLVEGGRANDLPGVRYTLIKGKFDFNYSENFNRIRRRSKYGIPKKKLNEF